MFSNFSTAKSGILLEDLSESQNSTKRGPFAYNLYEAKSAILGQNIDGIEKTIAFASRSLKPHERKYAKGMPCISLGYQVLPPIFVC